MNAHAQPPANPIGPCNIEAEQALLGAILINNDAFGRVSGFLKPEHFSEELHRRVFDTAGQLIVAGKVATPATLKTFLIDQDLGGMTVAQYLSRLASEATTIINAPDYGRAIHDLAVRRELIARGQAMIEAAQYAAPGASPMSILESHESELSDLKSQMMRSSGQATTLDGAVDKLVKRLTRKRQGLEPVAPTTGFIDLNRLVGGGFRPRRLYMFGARPGMGKAQPLRSKIKTKSGWTDFASVAVGERLASIDGSENIVTGVFPQGVKKTYRVTLSDGRSALCCAEHLWEVRYRDWDKPRVLETAKLIEMLQRVRYQNRLVVSGISGDFGDKTPLPLSPWLVGALLANGCLRSATTRFSSVDQETIDLVAAEAGALGVGMEFVRGCDYSLTAGVKGKENPLTVILRDLEMAGKLSSEKRIPPAYLLADRSQRIELLRGLMDCDGWVEKQGSALYASASEGLAKDVQELARSLGYWAKIARREAFVYDGNGGRSQKLDSFKIIITGPGIEEIVSLPRKRDRLENRSWFRALTVESIESVGEEECACISVSHPSKLYLTDDYVVTHNTTLLVASARRSAKAGNGVGILSLEIDDEENAARFVASAFGRDVAPLNYSDILTGNIHESRDADIEDMRRLFISYPVEIDCTEGLNLGAIESRARGMNDRLKRKGSRLQILYVDYLGLIAGGDRYKGSKVAEIGELVLGLRNMAKRMEIAVVLFSQLNRGVESREDKRPTKEDLRDSGNIEEHADVIGLLYRPAHYDEKIKKQLAAGLHVDVEDGFETLAENRKFDLEIILDKNRLGPKTTVTLFCDVGRALVEDGAPQWSTDQHDFGGL